MLVDSNIIFGLDVHFKQIHSIKENEILVNYRLDNGIEIIAYYIIQEKSYQFNFSFSKDYLLRFEEKYQKSFFVLGTSQQTYDAESVVCCKLHPVFEGIAKNQLGGILKAIFLESQALQVLLHTHTHCEEEEELIPCYNCKFLNNPTEKKKIMQARVLMLINISEPLSIPQLAKAVHINECYLKKGFKEMFGNSIFDFIQQERIKKAKILLQQNKISINEIAIELGYSNTSNFTNAFKKNTSYSPSDFRNNFLVELN